MDKNDIINKAFFESGFSRYEPGKNLFESLGIGIAGFVEINKWTTDPHQGGKFIETCFAGKNIITDNGLQKIALVIGKSNQTNNNMDRIGVGTGTNAETANDVTLTGGAGTEGVFSDVFDSITFPTTNSVQFEMILQNNEPASQPVILTEAGLFSAIPAAPNGVLVSRKVFTGPISKSNTFALQIRWTYTFTRI